MIFKRTNQASTQQDRIIFRFKTANQNGSLLQCGREQDYLVIELLHGFILLRWNLGSGEMYLHVREKACDDDKWHSVRIIRNQRQLNLTLDGVLHILRLFPGSFISFDLIQGEGDVFIGGMPANDFPSKSRSSGISFNGCIQEISFNGVDIVQGVVNGEEYYTTRGHPRSTCERPRDMDPTTTTTTTTTTTEQSTTVVSNSPTSYTTMTTIKDYTHSSKQVPSSHAEISSGSSVTPCSDDEDNCDSDDSGSGDGEDSSGANLQSSGDKSSSSSRDNTEENSIPSPNIGTNKSSKKPMKPLPVQNSSIVGEPDIEVTNCIQDDEDGCDKDDESGQSSTEIGSAGSASPTTTLSPVVSGSNRTKTVAHVRVKKDTGKKWALIAGIIVVGTLLVAFCIFAICWLCKNKNDPNWTGMYQGSTEKCLQAEITDV